MLNEAEVRVLNAAIRVNARIMAVAFGMLGGAILWISTAILLVRGGYDVGVHLSLLSVFLPGYSVTWTGAWIGLGWGFVIGAISGQVLYRGYARTLRERLNSRLLDLGTPSALMPPIFLISGNALGVGLGALLALQLLLSTNWLVVRGTAPYSKTAALIGQYLPGYTVSFWGSVIGAIELFVIAFVISNVFAGVYNFVAQSRAPREIR